VISEPTNEWSVGLVKLLLQFDCWSGFKFWWSADLTDVSLY
jgi:hypothetical protein